MPKSQVAEDTQIASSRILNIGCGNRRIADAINVDLTARTNPDVVHDLNCLPWPFPESHFKEVLAYDVIEHLIDTLAVFEEIHRVSRAGAIVRVTVPHFSCPNAFTDPTHRHQFGRFSFDYVTDKSENSFYTLARFREVSCQINFYPTLVNKLAWRIANRYPVEYERRWAWIFPAWYLYFELEVVKTH